jgi:hypothetical protein
MVLSEKIAHFALFALAIGAALVVAASAEAQSPTDTPKPHPQRKIVAPPQQSSPVAPGAELQTSVYEPVGSRNRYFTETIGPGVTGSLGQNGRDGQPLPLPDSSVLKFGF